MKHIYVNFKRFDVPREYGGVNSLAPVAKWASTIISQTQEALATYDNSLVEFAMFFPEAHLLNAAAAKSDASSVEIGCQSVHEADTAAGGNFGAFTTGRPAAAMKAAGCTYTIIGHCEERKALNDIFDEMTTCAQQAKNLFDSESTGQKNSDEGEGARQTNVGTDHAVQLRACNRILNKRVKCALERGLKVLYCIGEKSEEQERWQEVLGEQLEAGLEGTDRSRVVIAYEPVWSIGPGKTPADKDYITKIARFVKEKTGGMDVVYGGGLKTDNAKMLASIPEIDGGLIALTRFAGDIGFYPEEYLEIVRLYLK